MNPPGRKLTRKKQLFFFNKETLLATKNIIMSLLGMQEIKFYEKYLELPSLVVRGKRASFNYIKEKVWRKLQVALKSWEGKFNKSDGPIDLDIHNGSLLATCKIMWWAKPNVCKILVGTSWKWKKDTLEELGAAISIKNEGWYGFSWSKSLQFSHASKAGLAYDAELGVFHIPMPKTPILPPVQFLGGRWFHK